MSFSSISFVSCTSNGFVSSCLKCQHLQDQTWQIGRTEGGYLQAYDVSFICIKEAANGAMLEQEILYSGSLRMEKVVSFEDIMELRILVLDCLLESSIPGH